MVINTQDAGHDIPTDTPSRDLLISYVTLRRIVGVIGILLAFVLRIGIIVGNHKVPYSVSSYYYSPMRNVLVASLCILGMFLIAYKGHDNIETGITNIAGVAAIGVAFFPTSDPSFRPAWVSDLHPFFAAIALISLALMALQFTHMKADDKTGGAAKLNWWREIGYMGGALLFKYPDYVDINRKPNKDMRNRIYSSCAWIILVAVILAFAQNFWPTSAKNVTQWLFWFEALALVAFGFSWLIKGETFFTDPAPPDSNHSP